jgi:hypothetical protein
MPRNLTPDDRWETDFQVPLPGEPRSIGPLEILFQRLLNRTERLKGRIGAILGLPWDATPPDTLAGLAGRVSTLEGSQVGQALSAHRSAATLDHPDGSVTAAKLDAVRNAPTITPSLQDWLLGGLASGTGVGKFSIGALLNVLSDSNSNSNGSYIRFADGTQICWASHSPTSFGSNQRSSYQSGYSFRLKTWVFPAAFNSAPVVITGGDPKEEIITTTKSYNCSASQCTLEAVEYNHSGTVDVIAFYSIAIGRWR